jgi:hypothetical protein
MIQGQPWQKLVRLYLKNKPGMVAHTIILATWEVGELWLEAIPGKVTKRPYLKNKLKAKELARALA